MIQTKLFTFFVLLAASASSMRIEQQCDDILRVAINVLKQVDNNFGPHLPTTSEKLAEDCHVFKPTEIDIFNLLNPCLPEDLQPLVFPFLAPIIDPFVKDVCNPKHDIHDLYLESITCLVANITHALPCAEQLGEELGPILKHMDFTNLTPLCCPLAQAQFCIGEKVEHDCGPKAKQFIDDAADDLGAMLKSACSSQDCSGWLTDPPAEITTPTTGRHEAKSYKIAEGKQRHSLRIARNSPKFQANRKFIQESTLFNVKTTNQGGALTTLKDDSGCDDFLNVTINVLELVDDNFGPHLPVTSDELDNDCKTFDPTLKSILDIVLPCVVSPSLKDLIENVLMSTVDPVKNKVCDPKQDMHNQYLSSITCMEDNWSHGFSCIEQLAQELGPILLHGFSIKDLNKLCCPLAQAQFCLAEKATQDCGSDAGNFLNGVGDTLGQSGIFQLAECPSTDCSGWLTDAPNENTVSIAPEISN